MVRGTQRKKLYRTMQGRMVDIEKLRSMNENIRAVGNMNVNARGDIMGPGGTILKSKEQVIKEYYEAPKGVVADTPVKKMAIPQNKVVETKVINPVKEPQPIEGIKQAKKIDIFKPKTVETKTPETKSGIDAALDGIE